MPLSINGKRFGLFLRSLSFLHVKRVLLCEIPHQKEVAQQVVLLNPSYLRKEWQHYALYCVA